MKKLQSLLEEISCPYCGADIKYEAWAQHMDFHKNADKGNCLKTLSGKHLWPEYVRSDQAFMLVCTACGLIDDTKEERG